ANSVRSPGEALEEHRPRGDWRGGRESDRGDRICELALRIGRLGRPGFQSPLELEDAEAVGLPAEVRGEQAVGLGPELGELAGRSETDADVGAELDRGPAGRDPDQRCDGAVPVALAEERGLELRIGARVRIVLPVEAPAHLS